ncbi:MAG: hypothetical protein COB78_00455 [Hyphomicrobiales bacterium]|nr:MAG: hypothetical protein COB78_00455 [Hyphomicrobiales bacterium]
MEQISPHWMTIYRDIRGRIQQKQLGSGRQLPSQSQLSEQYGVPRYAVRRAFDRLREEKLIDSWQGRGAYVRSQPLIYEINERTKFGTDLRQVGRHVQIEILSLRPAQRAPTEITQMLGASHLDLIDVGEMIHHVDGSPTLIGRHYFSPQKFPNILTHLLKSKSAPQALSNFGVIDYRRAETRVESRLPTSFEAEQLNIAPSQPILQLRGRNVDADDNVVEVTEIIGRGDYIQLKI